MVGHRLYFPKHIDELDVEVLVEVWKELPWTMVYQCLKYLNGLVTCESQVQWDLLQIRNQYKIQQLLLLKIFSNTTFWTISIPHKVFNDLHESFKGIHPSKIYRATKFDFSNYVYCEMNHDCEEWRGKILFKQTQCYNNIFFQLV